MAKSDLTRIDLEIARFYAPLILGSLKYGENRICVWFPYVGEIRTLNNLLRSKTVIKEVLGKSASKFIFVNYAGIDSENAVAIEILQHIANELGIDSPTSTSNLKSLIAKKCEQLIDQGKEIVFVGNTFENLSRAEFEKHLLNICNIVRINQGRIHSILNISFFEEVEAIINKQPSLIALTNKIEYMPAISGKLLEDFVKKEALDRNLKLSTQEITDIKKYSGGLLTLTRSLIRNYNSDNNTELDLKFNTMWAYLPSLYKSVFEKVITKGKIVNPNDKLMFSILEKGGIINLNIFKEKYKLNQSKDLKTLEKLLNDNEAHIYKFFKKNKNKLVLKEDIATIIWGNNDEADYSDWAIDQKISRFRKKMAKLGMDPESLKTVKGKGYKWKL